MSDHQKAAPNQILNLRTVNAPQALVYRAWTDPKILALWWGPKGFSNAFHEFDLRPGGTWRFDMHGPDGKAYPNQCSFVEIGTERIVIDHTSAPEFLIDATFEEAAGKTTVRFCATFPSAEIRDKIASFAINGNEQMLDRLEAELAKLF